jgi:hypothetical protein
MFRAQVDQLNPSVAGVQIHHLGPDLFSKTLGHIRIGRVCFDKQGTEV